MRALVNLPDPTVLSFVSSVRLEVGDEVGIVVPDVWEWKPAGAIVRELYPIGTPAVVATSTITAVQRVVWPDCLRYFLAPLRECDPITDLPGCTCDEWADDHAHCHHRGKTELGPSCCHCGCSGRVSLPEVPTGEAVLLT